MKLTFRKNIVVFSLFIAVVVSVFASASIAFASPNDLNNCFFYQGTCPSGVKLIGLSALTNAHADLTNQSTLGYFSLCCPNVAANCTNNPPQLNVTAVFMRLISQTNSHVQEFNLTGNGYDYQTCFATDTTANCTIVEGNQPCPTTPYNYSCLLTYSGVTNAHVGDCTAFTGASDRKLCCFANSTAVNLTYINYLGALGTNTLFNNISYNYDSATTGSLNCFLSNDNLTWSAISCNGSYYGWDISAFGGNASEGFKTVVLRVNVSGALKYDNKTIVYDLSPPFIIPYGPASDQCNPPINTLPQIDFNVKAYDSITGNLTGTMKNCTIYINNLPYTNRFPPNVNASNATNVYIPTPPYLAFSVNNIPNGTFSWKVRCYDFADNFNDSEPWVLQGGICGNISGSNLTDGLVINTTFINSNETNCTISFSGLINNTICLSSNMTNGSAGNYCNISGNSIMNSSGCFYSTIGNQSLLINSNATNSTVNQSTLLNTNATNSTVELCNLTNTNANSTICYLSNLTLSNLSGCIVNISTMSSSNCVASNLTDNTTITNSNVTSSTFSLCNLTQANISDTTCYNATNDGTGSGLIDPSTIANMTIIGNFSIRNSTVTNTVFINSAVLNTTVDASRINLTVANFSSILTSNVTISNVSSSAVILTNVNDSSTILSGSTVIASYVTSSAISSNSNVTSSTVAWSTSVASSNLNTMTTSFSTISGSTVNESTSVYNSTVLLSNVSGTSRIGSSRVDYYSSISGGTNVTDNSDLFSIAAQTAVINNTNASFGSIISSTTRDINVTGTDINQSVLTVMTVANSTFGNTTMTTSNVSNSRIYFSQLDNATILNANLTNVIHLLAGSIYIDPVNLTNVTIVGSVTIIADTGYIVNSLLDKIDVFGVQSPVLETINIRDNICYTGRIVKNGISYFCPLNLTQFYGPSMVINNNATYTLTPDVVLNIDPGNGISCAFQNETDGYTSWEVCNVTRNWTLDAPDGIRTVWIEINDTAGNLKFLNDSILLDTTPPNATIFANNNESTTNTIFIFLNLTASDATSGINSTNCMLSNDNITWTPSIACNGIVPWVLPYGDGPKIIYFKANDLAGNNFTTTTSILLDTVVPTVTANSGANWTNNNTANLSLTYDATVTLCQFSNDNATWYNSSGNLNSWDAPCPGWIIWNLLTDSPGDGIKSVFFRTNNTIGTIEEASDTIGLDTNLPSVVMNPTPAVTNISAFSISGNFSDVVSGSGVASVAVTLNGVPASFSTNVSLPSYVGSYNSILSLVSGPNLIIVSVTDQAGNVNSTNSTVIYSPAGALDTIPPIIYLNTPANGSWVQAGNTAFTYTPMEVWTFITNCTLAIDNVNYTNSTPVINGVLNSFTVNLPNQGTSLWNITCSDIMPNVGTSSTFVLSVDNESPQINSVSIMYPPGKDQVKEGQMISVRVNASDTGSGIAAILINCTNLGGGIQTLVVPVVGNANSGTWVAQCGLSGTPLAEDNISISITAVDGVFYAQSTDVNVSVDNIPPPNPSPIDIVLWPAGNNASVNISWSATSDAVAYNIFRSTAANFSILPSNMIATTTNTYYIDTPGTDGTWYWKVTAVDNLGNENRTDISENSTIIDTGAPSITNIQVSYPAGQTAAKNGDVIRIRATITDPQGIVSESIDVSQINTTAGNATPTNIGGNVYELNVTIDSTSGDDDRYVYVYATDNVGNVRPGVSATVAMDNSVPEITVIDDGNFTATTTTIHAMWNALDNKSSLTYRYMVYDNFGNQIIPWTSTTLTDITRTVSPPLSESVTYYWAVNATDSAANSFVNYTDGIDVDTTPPVFVSISDTGAWTNAHVELNASWVAQDTESGISRYQYRFGEDQNNDGIVDRWFTYYLNESMWKNDTFATGPNKTAWIDIGLNTSVSAPISLPQGLANNMTYFFQVKAENGAGSATYAMTDGIRTDYTNPQITSGGKIVATGINLTAVSPGALANTNAVNITYQCTDTISGVQNCSLSFDYNNSLSPTVLDVTGGLTTSYIYNMLQDGLYQFIMVAYDNAGNTDNTSLYALRDTVAPITTVVAVQNDSSADATAGWVSKDVNVTLNVNNFNPSNVNISGINATYYCLDGACSAYAGTFYITSIGNHTLSYWSTDLAGNTEGNNTVNVLVVDNSTIVNSNLTNSNVSNSNIINSTVNYCNINSSDVNNSQCNNSGIYSSLVFNNSIVTNNSVINGSIINNATANACNSVNTNLTFNSQCINSSAYNSSLYNVTIINSTIVNKVIRNAIIRDSYVDPIMENMTIENSVVTQSDVMNALINNSFVSNSNISNSTILNSNLTNMTVIDSVVTRSTLMNVSITGGSLTGMTSAIINNTDISGTGIASIFPIATINNGLIVSGVLQSGTATCNAGYNLNALPLALAQVCTAPPTPPSPGFGGGGGGGGSISTNYEEKTFPYIAAGQCSTTSFVLIDRHGVSQITICVSRAVSNVIIRVQDIGKPSYVTLPSGSIYKYINVTKINLNDNDITGVTFKFAISKAWLKSVGASDSLVSLQRWVSQWYELNTTKYSENSLYSYFQTESPGMSVFSFVVKSAQCAACQEPTPWSECVDEKQSRTNYLCSADTGFSCSPVTETRACTVIAKYCPVCPAPTEWSVCTNGAQYRTENVCGADTNYECKVVTANQTCEVRVCPKCPESSAWTSCVDNSQFRINYKCGSDTNYECERYDEKGECLILGNISVLISDIINLVIIILVVVLLASVALFLLGPRRKEKVRIVPIHREKKKESWFSRVRNIEVKVPEIMRESREASEARRDNERQKRLEELRKKREERERQAEKEADERSRRLSKLREERKKRDEERKKQEEKEASERAARLTKLREERAKRRAGEEKARPVTKHEKEKEKGPSFWQRLRSQPSEKPARAEVRHERAEEVEEEVRKEVKAKGPKELKCAICGKPEFLIHTCDVCGKEVCYRDVKFVNGRVICTKCLKKK